MRRIVGFLVVLCLLLGVSRPALAAPKPTGLQIFPLRARPVQQPGDTTTGQITVTNYTKDSMNVTLSVERFKTIDEDYHYDFAPGEHTDWVRLADKKVTLVSEASHKIAYSLAVPADAPPGGYYFAVFASTENTASSSNFIEVKRVASLIYLEVGGLVTRKINLLGIDAPWFLTHRSIPIDSRFANQGNTHNEARLKLTVRPFIGHVPESIQAEGLILPSTIRKIHSAVKIPFWPGIYSLQAHFSPPQGGSQDISQLIVYFPIWAWVLTSLIIASIFTKIWHKRYAKKNYKDNKL